MTEIVDAAPAPPDATNDLRAAQQQQQGNKDGVFVPLQQLQGLARMYVQFRPIIGWGARLAKQKIPQDLDEAMQMIAAGGDPAALQALAAREQGEGQPQQWTGPQQYGPSEVPQDTPGTPVMTHNLAEEAYYLHTVKHMGVRDIAQQFTDQGNPVSKATVARYIDDVEQEMQEQEGQRWKLAARGGMILLAWLGSAFGLSVVLRFLHVL